MASESLHYFLCPKPIPTMLLTSSPFILPFLLSPHHPGLPAYLRIFAFAIPSGLNILALVVHMPTFTDLPECHLREDFLYCFIYKKHFGFSLSPFPALSSEQLSIWLLSTSLIRMHF